MEENSQIYEELEAYKENQSGISIQELENQIALLKKRNEELENNMNTITNKTSTSSAKRSFFG